MLDREALRQVGPGPRDARWTVHLPGVSEPEKSGADADPGACHRGASGTGAPGFSETPRGLEQDVSRRVPRGVGGDDSWHRVALLCGSPARTIAHGRRGWWLVTTFRWSAGRARAPSMCPASRWVDAAARTLAVADRLERRPRVRVHECSGDPCHAHLPHSAHPEETHMKARVCGACTAGQHDFATGRPCLLRAPCAYAYEHHCAELQGEILTCACARCA